MRWLLGVVFVWASSAGLAQAQDVSCERTATALWAAAPWGELAPNHTVVPPNADEDHFFQTLELESELLVAGIVKTSGYRGRPSYTDSIAVWRLRCEASRWTYVDGFMDGHGNHVELCLEGAELAVLRLETGTRVPGTFVRIEAKFDTCGVACGTWARRFLLVDVGDARTNRAFACTTHADMYVVSDEQAESYGGGEEERRRLVRYASGGRIRTRRRAPTSGPWVVFTWNGQAFVDERGDSDCDRPVGWR